ncbi:DUF1330 domain-containing protein [Vibrio cyclitrophicus]|uniref:DUF1330 domain-containing protein n=1 Tax=Vibrio cyclitrophicus TaxID=47951 RepID=UPI0002E482CE|nr:DUF1330 domain-containing protein [Vibrio cyclitrophicus]OCH49619.1 hypothetical protein A6D96_13475 [Vibrio cyclitrophicus]UPR54067.1 DUF1330 domain-containing protein [Vibrio cyclitrophicus]
MTAYYVVNYDIADEELYAQYNPGLNHVTANTVAKHGGEILVATSEGQTLSGQCLQMKVIIQFPSREAALAWDNDIEYRDAKLIRLAATTNIDCYLVDKLVVPS